MTETPSANPNVRIFSVDTRFHQMAQRPGGVPREQAIERAQSHVDSLKDDFVDWAEREVKALSSAFNQIQDEGQTAPDLDGIYHRCCQLRDTGTTMGLELITFVADNLCQVLDSIKSGAAYDADVVSCHIHALMLAKQKNYRNLRPDQAIEMTSGLQKILDRTKKVNEPAG